MEDSHTLLCSLRLPAFDYFLHTQFALPVLFFLILHWIISIYSLDLWDLLTYFAFSQQLSMSSLRWLLSLCRLTSTCFILYLSVLRQLIQPERVYAVAACELHIYSADYQDTARKGKYSLSSSPCFFLRRGIYPLSLLSICGFPKVVGKSLESSVKHGRNWSVWLTITSVDRHSRQAETGNRSANSVRELGNLWVACVFTYLQLRWPAESSRQFTILVQRQGEIWRMCYVYMEAGWYQGLDAYLVIYVFLNEFWYYIVSHF